MDDTNGLKKADLTRMKQTLLRINQTIEKLEKMLSAGLDVGEDLAKMKEAKDAWTKLWSVYGK